MRPDISIVIVNWKAKDFLKKCLKSIFDYQNDYQVEVFVVDNDSQDGSVEMLKEKFPQVILMPLAKNIGFGAANNLAIDKAQAEYIFLLNPDTELTKDFLDHAFVYMQSNPGVGIIAPKILNSDGSQQLSIRRNPNLLSQILVLFKLINILPNNRILSNYLFKNFDYTKEQSVDQIMGAAMLIHKSVFEKIGIFDEKFFIWFEEVDLCKRARQANISIRYFPGAEIVHHGGESFSQANSLKKQLFFNNSLLYYFYKHKAIWQSFIILLLIPINIILTLVYVIFFKRKTK
ncbi:MAG: glycosyltransferase family 2 protein [Candidatus Komeilibacteria bacterium]|jgi:O-antigen biosynthesis protein|nr:glycosyltransferase family 2 protein [Candidatus Komeilibacteria bacterium]MBT4447642.1 glycosyltransferase family 2 protein [Candidatus Komeilibacteria bacterium]